jgi:hypothetical protein
MINLYVKANARAFFLDRCLTSIAGQIAGGGRVIVLNDGITGAALERLTALHPTVHFRSSDRIPAGKPAKARASRVNPARFWVREIAADPGDHVLILEEDTWLTAPLDLTLLEPEIRQADALLLRLYWGSNAAMSIAGEIIRTVPGDHGRQLHHYQLPLGQLELRQIYKIFPLAQSIFRKEYWVAAYAGTPYWDDEGHVLGRALTYVNQQLLARRPIAFLSLDREVIRHTAISTSRTDSGGQGVTRKIDAALYNTALNEAWLEGEIDAMANFPADPADEVVLEALRRRLSAAQIEAWLLWREDYKRMYRSLGVQL